jgi:hypothetical protein
VIGLNGNTNSSLPGLDPGIHLFKKFAKKMDARVEPGHDDSLGSIVL